ncbi:MAG: O-antigen ligase family protein [Spirochaetia bacterium]|nr:O-antigen ligase family protein [Spirochaetia bacterium]
MKLINYKYLYSNIKKVTTFLSGIIFLVVPLAYYRDIIEESAFAKYEVFYFLIIILCLFYFFSIKYKKINFELLKSNYASFFIFILILFGLWHAVCTLFSINILISFGKTLEIISKIFVVFLFFSIARYISYTKVIFWGMIGVFFVSIIGIFQRFELIDYYAQVAAPASTFVNKNHAAHYMGMAYFFSILIFLFSKSKKTLLISGLCVFTQTAYSMFTSSKGLVVSLAVSIIYLIILFYFSNKRSKLNFIKMKSLKFKLLITIILSSIIFSSLVEKFYPGNDYGSNVFSKIANIIPDPLQSNSIVSRLAVWRNSIEIVKDYPVFGVGPNAFQIIYSNYNKAVFLTPDFSPYFIYTKAHNEIIEYAVDTGFIGGFLFLIIAFSIPLLTFYTIKKKKSRLLVKDKYFIYLSAALVNTFCYSAFEFSTSTAGSGILMWPLMGLWLYQLNLLSAKIKFINMKKIKDTLNIFFNAKKNKSIIYISFVLTLIMFIVYSLNIRGALFFYTAEAHWLNTKHQLSNHENQFSCDYFTRNINKAASFMFFDMHAQRTRANEFVRCNLPSEENLEKLEKFLEDDPYALALWYNIIKYKIELEKYNEAQQLLDKFLTLYDLDINILLLKGNIFELKKENIKAYQWYSYILNERQDISLETRGFLEKRLKKIRNQ